MHFIRGRRAKIFIILAAAAVTALVVAVTQGGAGAGARPDGMMRTEAPAVLVTNFCGPDVSHIFRTENAASVMVGAAFVGLAGTAVGFSVPAGTTRCVIAEFSAETACTRDVGPGNDFCYIRVLLDGIPMHPQDNVLAWNSEDETAEVGSHQFVRRVGAGNHFLVVQRRTDGGNTAFFTDDWTLEVSTHF